MSRSDVCISVLGLVWWLSGKSGIYVWELKGIGSRRVLDEVTFCFGSVLVCAHEGLECVRFGVCGLWFYVSLGFLWSSSEVITSPGIVVIWFLGFSVLRGVVLIDRCL